ncbi:Polygalacturonase ADPG1 [Hordeum vulgare]|nr:Polygalacturonase ADPG1 [Hordeum vulgare]
MPYPFPSFTTGHMCAARRLPPDAQMRLTFPTNLRHSLRPPLPARYFGNGIILLGAACKVRDVVAAGSGDQAPLASVAGRIRDAVRGLHDELRSPAGAAASGGAAVLRAYVVPLTVTKKSLSLSDGDFAITDANGAVVLKVKGAIFSIRSRRTILDGAGMPLLTMQEKVMGTITAPPASSWSEKKNHWLMFYLVDGLTVTGNSARLLDGIGQTWWVDKCKAHNDALVVMNCTDVELSQFSSKDSPEIHIGLSMSGKVNVTQLTITAPENSPNTDGVHVDRSEDVHITGSTIGTGDYCISIGPESRFVTVDGIISGPGHGVRFTFFPICPCQNDVFFLSPTPPPTSTSSTCLPGTKVPLLPAAMLAFLSIDIASGAAYADDRAAYQRCAADASWSSRRPMQ